MMSDKRLPQFDEIENIDNNKIYYIPVTEDGSFKKINLNILSSSPQPKEGQIVYVTYDNNALSLNHESIVSNIYYNGYGVITLSSSNEIPSNLINNKQTLKSLTIPGTFNEILDSAFCDNVNLREVNLYNGITKIGKTVFKNCSSLRDIIIPDSVTEIGEYAFNFCSSLLSIKLSNNLISLPEGIFSGCSSLIEIKIPESVQSIGGWAFEECNSLISLVIPDSVTTLEDEGVIDKMKNLISISFGCGLDELNGIINECPNIKTINIPENITSISNSFSQCNLDFIEIPDSIISIDDCFWETTCKKIDYSSSLDLTQQILPSLIYLEELTIKTNKVLEGLDIINTPSNSQNILYSKPLSKLKIYVPENLLADYEEKYSEFAYRFHPITGDDNIYAYRSETYTKSEVDDKLENIESDSNVDLSELYDKDTEIMETIVKLHADVNISISPTIIEMNTPTNININSTAKFDGKDLTRTLIVDDEPLSNPYSVTLTQTNPNSGTTSRKFNVTMTINNEDPKIQYVMSKDLTVTAYYPKFVGIIDKDEITDEDFTLLEKQNISSSVFISNKTISSEEGGYLWLCVPSNMTINNVTSGGFAMPFESPIIVAYDFNGSTNNYKCYRSTNRINSGSTTFSAS